MNLLSDIEKIEKRVFWIGLFNLIFLVAPGVLLFFICDRNLFLSLDIIKLILLSFSVATPFAFVQSAVFGITQKSKTEDIMIDFTLGILVTSCGFYITFLFNYLLKLSFIETIFILIFIVFILAILIVGASKKKK